MPIKQKIWAKKGSKPQLPFWFSSTKANIFGALVDGKKMFYSWYKKLNAHSFIEFLTKFISTLDLSKKYVFILDNAPAHRAKMTIEFIKEFDLRYGENPGQQASLYKLINGGE